jgi:hypothetical protein
MYTEPLQIDSDTIHQCQKINMKLGTSIFDAFAIILKCTYPDSFGSKTFLEIKHILQRWHGMEKPSVESVMRVLAQNNYVLNCMLVSDSAVKRVNMSREAWMVGLFQKRTKFYPFGFVENQQLRMAVPAEFATQLFLQLSQP